MNKSEFVNFIANKVDCSKAQAERTLNIIIDSVIMAIQKGESINLVGFGSFSISKRAAREGRNPKTGEKMRMQAYNHPMFKAGQKLKDACNNT